MTTALVERRNQHQGEHGREQPGGANNKDEFPKQRVISPPTIKPATARWEEQPPWPSSDLHGIAPVGPQGGECFRHSRMALLREQTAPIASPPSVITSSVNLNSAIKYKSRQQRGSDDNPK